MIQGTEKKERLLICAGAVVACLIGSGYATGQEILQFFAAYGRFGFLGLGLSIAGLAVLVERVMRDSYERKEETPVGVLRYYCGEKAGRLFGFLMPVILFSTLIVMVSGAGTAMEEYYGWNPYAGRLLILIPIYLTVVMGLDKLVEIIGFLGPFTILFTLIICIDRVLHPEVGLFEAYVFMERAEVTRAAGSWWLSAVLYTSFNLTMSLAFFAGMGAHAASAREAGGGSVMGTVAYGVAAFFMNGALLTSFPAMEGVSIPMLYLADRLHPFFGYVFSLILISEIYTTAVPSLWALTRMYREEKSAGFSRLVLLLLGAAFLCSLLPFETLIHHIYPMIGWAGMFLLFGIARKMIGPSSGKR
ncbi:MAG: hypothetical protein HFI93_07115 [Lachnospiraceae bacterium]|nr:hypothetical protein [Lachnospiraceae bacterium]